MKLLLNLIIGLLLIPVSYSQCYDDACDDDNDISVPGCCTATTAGMTWSGYGDIDCVNMGTATNPDTWISFTAPTTGFIQVTIDNITQNGITQFVVFDHQNAEVCSSLNSFGLLAGAGCNDLPGDGVGGVTSIDTVQYMVEAGERYWLLVSADVQNGATPGTFIGCIAIVPPPPPPPPAPGQDCVDAEILCNSSGGGFTVPVLDLGDGLVDEQSGTGWSSCILNEQSSQWYTFTASAAGSFEMMLTPASYNSATQTGDDFDWELYDITTSGCTNAAVSLACDYSGCSGTTGYSSSGAAGFGQVAVTDYQANNPPGPGDCLGGPQWNTTTVNLVAGNTYALIIQNYTGSLGGVSVDFQGTAVMGPTADQALFNASLDPNGCIADLTTATSAIPNYTYEWDFGDGSTAIGAGNGSHTYGAAGTYIVNLTLTDPLGCTESSQQIIDVAACIPLPVELAYFDAQPLKDRVQVLWKTQSEIMSDYFIVEKSTDLTNWKEIEIVHGNGTTTVEHSYFTIDRTPYFGISYYRLVQVDINGDRNYVTPVAVQYAPDTKVELVKITNILGEEVDADYTGVVYYFYSDGSKETVMKQ